MHWALDPSIHEEEQTHHFLPQIQSPSLKWNPQKLKDQSIIFWWRTLKNSWVHHSSESNSKDPPPFETLRSKRNIKFTEWEYQRGNTHQVMCKKTGYICKVK